MPYVSFYNASEVVQATPLGPVAPGAFRGGTLSQIAVDDAWQALSRIGSATQLYMRGADLPDQLAYDGLNTPVAALDVQYSAATISLPATVVLTSGSNVMLTLPAASSVAAGTSRVVFYDRYTGANVTVSVRPANNGDLLDGSDQAALLPVVLTGSTVFKRFTSNGAAAWTSS